MAVGEVPRLEDFCVEKNKDCTDGKMMGASYFSGLSSDDRYMFQALKGIFV